MLHVGSKGGFRGLGFRIKMVWAWKLELYKAVSNLDSRMLQGLD